MNKKLYKPILVLYLKDLEIMNDLIKSELMIQVGAMKDELGYHILLLPSDENKAEIISVEKATKVDDIQKYIDSKFLEISDETEYKVNQRYEKFD